MSHTEWCVQPQVMFLFFWFQVVCALAAVSLAQRRPLPELIEEPNLQHKCVCTAMV